MAESKEELKSLLMKVKEESEKTGLKFNIQDFLGGAVDNSPSANAKDTGSIPGPGRSHVLWSN